MHSHPEPPTHHPTLSHTGARAHTPDHTLSWLNHHGVRVVAVLLHHGVPQKWPWLQPLNVALEHVHVTTPRAVSMLFADASTDSNSGPCADKRSSHRQKVPAATAARGQIVALIAFAKSASCAGDGSMQQPSHFFPGKYASVHMDACGCVRAV